MLRIIIAYLKANSFFPVILPGMFYGRTYYSHSWHNCKSGSLGMKIVSFGILLIVWTGIDLKNTHYHEKISSYWIGLPNMNPHCSKNNYCNSWEQYVIQKLSQGKVDLWSPAPSSAGMRISRVTLPIFPIAAFLRMENIQ